MVLEEKKETYNTGEMVVMLKRIYSKYEDIGKGIKDIILKDEVYSLKQLLYLFAIPGSKITWKGQKTRFKVIARNDNFIIIARPYNPKRIYEYSILDLEYMECSRDNSIFGPKYNYSDKEECKEALKELQIVRDYNHKTNIAGPADSNNWLELSRRAVCNIENVVTELWIKVEVK